MFKEFNIFEKVVTIVGIVLTVVTGVLNKSSLIVLFNGVISIFCAVYTSKGKIATHYFALLGSLSYIFIAVEQKYYAEVLFQTLVCLPFDVIGIINWRKNLDDVGTVIPKKLSPKEIVLTCLSQVILFYPFYLIFKFFNSDQLIISTITICLNILALYFTSKSCSIFYYFFISADFLRIILWIIPFFTGKIGYIPTFLSQVFYFVIDCYGLMEWKKREKQLK